MTEKHIVTRDGKELFSGTANDCYAWLLKHQGQSVHYATTHGGYAIKKAEAGERRMKIEIRKNTTGRTGYAQRTAEVPEDFFERADKLGHIAEGIQTPEFWAREVGTEHWTGFHVDPERAHVAEY